MVTDSDDLRARTDTALDVVLEGDGAVALAKRYFDPAGPFAARTFHADGVNRPSVIGRDDLLAVTLLDVRLRPLAVRCILEQSSAAGVLDEEKLPFDRCLWDATSDELDALDELRSWLMHGTHDRGDHKGVGYVIADKIAARKRPNLVPIIDQAVLRVVGPIGSRREFWPVLGELLTPKRQARLDDINRQLRATGDDVPLVRLLDSLLWMHGSNSTNAREARDEERVVPHRADTTGRKGRG